MVDPFKVNRFSQSDFCEVTIHSEEILPVEHASVIIILNAVSNEEYLIEIALRDADQF